MVGEKGGGLLGGLFPTLSLSLAGMAWWVMLTKWSRTRPSLVLPEWLLRSERVQEFIEITGPDGAPATAYKCWETFYGVLAPTVRLTVGKKLENGFEAWGKDLAARAESRRPS